MASDAASFDMTTTDLAMCVGEIQKLLQLEQEREATMAEAEHFFEDNSGQIEFEGDQHEMAVDFIGKLLALETAVDAVELPTDPNSPGMVYTGDTLLDWFGTYLGITSETKGKVSAMLRKVSVTDWRAMLSLVMLLLRPRRVVEHAFFYPLAPPRPYAWHHIPDIPDILDIGPCTTLPPLNSTHHRDMPRREHPHV